MKHLFTYLFAILIATAAYAQPTYDECISAYDMGTAPLADCPVSVTGFYNNGCTESNIASTTIDEIPTCFQNGFVGEDVWLSFVCNDDTVDYTITLTQATGCLFPGIVQPQLALYRGDCEIDGLAEVGCVSAVLGQNNIELDVYGLTPGVTYYLRINAWSTSAASNAGCFNICVQSLLQDPDICGGGSTANFGELYDSGGDVENYEPNQNCTYTICPSDPQSCIIFDMQYYNIEANAESLIFYNGDDATAPVIGQLNGGYNNNNGGGVCFTVYGTEDCMTIVFVSDGTTELEGFAGSWTTTTEDCPETELLDIQGLPTDETLAKQIIAESLESPQTTIDPNSITIDCPNSAMGVFENGQFTNLGLNKGLLLTSGSAIDVENQGNFFSSEFLGNGGDPELNYLSSLQGNNSASNDACIIELDVYAAADLLSFEYVFGSEEYPEFVNTSFNDIFAFLVSGPGITGDPNIADQDNIAILPDGVTFVQINSVNNQQNWEYYRQNFSAGGFGNTTYSNTSGLNVCYDGLTSDSLGLVKKSLTAKKTVIPCNTYHLKLAVADRGDTAYDSGVFISEISAGAPNISVQFNNGVDYLIEGCTVIEDDLIIEMPEALQDTATFLVTIAGTATNGVDYVLNLPNVITFLPGQLQIPFPLSVIDDNIPEPNTENIVITLYNNFGCGDVVYATLDITIADGPIVVAMNGQDTTYACAGSDVPLSVTGAASYIWTPFNPLDGQFSANPIFENGNSSQWIYVNGTVGICEADDSVYVQVISPQVFATSTDYEMCEQEFAVMTAVDNVNHQGLTWTPTLGITSDPTLDNVIISPDVTTTYTAQVTIAGCTASSSVTIQVDEFDYPTPYTLDTTLCEGYSIFLAPTIQNTTTIYTWTPEAILWPSGFVSGPIATPTEDVDVVLIAISANGYCFDTDTVHINVVPANITIQAPDTSIICLGDTVFLGTQSNGGGNGIEWITFDPEINGNTGVFVNVIPDQSYWYYATLNIEDCQVVDSVYIRVDSLPSLALSIVPEQSIYCIGDVLSIVSSTYDPIGFPNIEHAWSPGLYTESELDQFNLVVIANETITYTRISANNACADTISIEVPVVDPSFPVTVSDTLVCPGETVTLAAEAPDPSTTWEWTPAEILSCADCPNPTATITGPVTISVTGTTGECESNGSVSVDVHPVPDVSIVPNPGGTVVTGTEVELTAVTNPDISNTGSFAWTGTDVPAGANGYQITVTVLQPGPGANVYNVAVISADGCEGAATWSIDGIEDLPSIPGAFSPNGDDTNDNFNVVYKNSSFVSNNVILTFQVFDRWGQVVYNNENPTGGWDGRFNGQDLPSDVYMYNIILKKANGEEVRFDGDVTLLR